MFFVHWIPVSEMLPNMQGECMGLVSPSLIDLGKNINRNSYFEQETQKWDKLMDEG